MRRDVNPNIRALLFQRSEGRCEHLAAEGRCPTAITLESFHAAHLRSVKSGGTTVFENLQAWCRRCNLTNGARDAGDPRLTPRPWQLDAMEIIPERILQRGVATVAAAPGAGKTFFAGLIFDELRRLGQVERLVVFTPRDALVDQWADHLRRDCSLELTRGQAHERTGTVGTVCTYQSLHADSVRVHQGRARAERTLLVFDEVHHLGEPLRETGQRPAWARYAMDIAGEIGGLHVAGVLNLSGTLWRSERGERISTVEYHEEGGRLVSDVDFEVTASDLILQGQLRPVDLWRVDATAYIRDNRDITQIVSAIADLDDPAHERAAIAGLPREAQWRETFVTAVLDRLEAAWRSINPGSVTPRVPMKGLIVCSRQQDAREFQKTANRLMDQRRLKRNTVLAISDDGPEAARALRDFKTRPDPGVLVTVNMAGEGYDCPEIIVIGYASNKLTPLYVRQVVARAQRVTTWERDRLGKPLPASIVIPNVANLLQHMTNILQPMRHEIQPAIPGEPAAPPGSSGGVGGGQDPRFELQGVEQVREGDARVTGVTDGDVDRDLIARIEPHARASGLPEAQVTRWLWAMRQGLKDTQAQDPFTPVQPADQTVLAGAAVPDPGTRREESATVEVAEALQRKIHKLEGWWTYYGDKQIPIAKFAADVNREAGIAWRGRDQASVEQLRRAWHVVVTRIRQHCQATGTPLPTTLGGGDSQ